MAKVKHYTVDSTRKVVNAEVGKLKAKELNEVKNYLALGYELVEIVAPVLTKEEKKQRAEENKAKKEAESIANPYSKENVEKFLRKKENKDLLDEYNAKYNEQAGTNRMEKGVAIPDEPKYLKSGKPKKKGYANCIGWFTSKFEYDEETKEYVPKPTKETK